MICHLLFDILYKYFMNITNINLVWYVGLCNLLQQVPFQGSYLVLGKVAM